MIHAALHELPHSHRGPLAGSASPAAPRSVLRAEEFMRAHSSEDITLAEIVQASGVSRRALHGAFRRFRETTPVGFLRELRLSRARELLIAGHAASVTDAAQECGLHHLGRFAREYARRFGEAPSSTMRRARR
jgi:AraC-like DNA-binding protein